MFRALLISFAPSIRSPAQPQGVTMDQETLLERLAQAARQSQAYQEAILKFAARALPPDEAGGLAEKFRAGSGEIQREIAQLAAAAILANPARSCRS
jgi:hypothetical protein